MGRGSDAQTRLMELLSRLELPPPAFDYPFLIGEDILPSEHRRYELDLAWPAVKLGVEVEGSIWTGGAHGRGTGIVRDMAKQNVAVLNGWRVLRVTTREAESGTCIPMIAKALGLVVTIQQVEAVDHEHPGRRRVRMRKEMEAAIERGRKTRSKQRKD